MFFCHITQNNEKMYFCNEQHFQSMNSTNIKKEEIIHFINDATGANMFAKRLQTFTKKYVNAYETHGMTDSLHHVLRTQRHSIRKYLDTIPFAHDNARIKYLLAMIHDNVVRDYNERERNKRQQIEYKVEIYNDDEVKVKPKPSKKRRDISDFL